ncbi:hypothetical protein MO767_13800 [Pseudomonas sp. UYIF39]|uniref:hypothetical protein n=1 Tax=Pseudomonas sp. UYIF39 TaxID=1630747 RepID=UPI00249F1357|nr:hypothetical protein [Pseudomonas sp. UYIF39]MDI3355419.1 hypothetical protein [Pseudomonas sp. UYIF39]
MPTSKIVSTLFGQGELSIISDSEDFLRECAHQGFNTAHISEIEKLPKNSIIFSFSNDAAKLTFDIAKNTKNKKCVFCATQVFEPSLASALYSLELLLSSNFEHALCTQRSVLNMLNSNESFFLSGNDADARVTIFPHAQPYALLAEDIEQDFVQSVAEFFEVHYAHMNPQESCPFSFSGTLKIAGILTVLRKPNPTLPEGLKTSLKWLSDRISEEGACLSVEDNIITSLKVKNEEHIKLLDLAAGSRGLKLTEFAIGVNEAIAPSIDYKINSQMNEGISGVHLAIGDGSSGYHIDFLSPAVSVSPVH